MSLRALFLLLVLIVLTVFTVLNWSAFMTPTTLSLLFATVQAPLGLIMLGVMVLLGAVFLLYLVYVQTAVLLDTRRSARELKTQRDLADQAETSRFTELHSFLEGRLQKLETVVMDAQSRSGARLDQLDSDFRTTVERATNTLASYIGELEDRLDRRLGDGGARPAA
jgi:uncharacterized integral membrane protein